MSVKARASMLTVAVSGLLLSAAAIAYPSGQVQTAPAGASSSATAGGNSGVTFHSNQGEIVTIRATQSQSQTTSPPPAFASLDTDHSGSLSPQEAAAYPPLANDFEHADSNRNGKISKSEYQHWVNEP
jgi:hypothetical protein